MATNASTTPLFETEVRTLVDRPFTCWDANRMNITANTRKLNSGPALRFQNRLRDHEWTLMGAADWEAGVVGAATLADEASVGSSDRVGLASPFAKGSEDK